MHPYYDTSNQSGTINTQLTINRNFKLQSIVGIELISNQDNFSAERQLNINISKLEHHKHKRQQFHEIVNKTLIFIYLQSQIKKPIKDQIKSAKMRIREMKGHLSRDSWRSWKKGWSWSCESALATPPTPASSASSRTPLLWNFHYLQHRDGQKNTWSKSQKIHTLKILQ